MTLQPLPKRKSFSENLPWFQHTWDSSSLSNYLRCPRRYFYQTVCGFTPKSKSVDLFFGTLIHSAMETYHTEKPAKGHTEAQILGLQKILSLAWQEGPQGPSYWRSQSNNKNLWNALRAFVWHTEAFGLEPDTFTCVIGDSLLGVELPFQFDLDFSVAGHEAVYCGHMDRLVESSGSRWVIDYKTTTKTVNATYFDSYQPSTQLPGYAVAAKIVFHEPVQGVIIDAMQVGVDFVRCARGHILLGEERANEWLENTSKSIYAAMTHSASIKPPEPTYDLVAFATTFAHEWRMNTESCFICPFKIVCASTPSIRGHLLASAYVNSFWDPLARQSTLHQEPANS